MERLREKILETLGDDELIEKEIRDTIGGNTGAVGKALRKLLAENEVTREGSGRRGDPFRYKKFLVSRFSIGVKQEKQENKEARGDDTLNAKTPLTDGKTHPPTIDRYEAILGMAVDKVIEIWRSEGAPVIHLGHGENCHDLKKLLTSHDVKTYQLEAMSEWLGQRKNSAEEIARLKTQFLCWFLEERRDIATCKRMGISSSTLSDWMDKDPEFKQRYDNIVLEVRET